MALAGGTIEVPLIALDQSWPVTAGPAGRLRRLNNAVARKWLATQAGPVLRVEKRDGFGLLTQVIRDPSTGGISSKSMASPTVFTSFGKQLVAVAGAAAFVLSEAAGCWESPNYYCPTEVLRYKPVLPPSATLNAPDSARIGSRTMYVWAPVAGVWASIVDDDGTVVRDPFLVDPDAQTVKVVSDGTRFWIVKYRPGAVSIDAGAWDTNGVGLGTNSMTASASGYYDVIKHPTAADSIYVVQKTPAAGTFDLNKFTWNGSTVTKATAQVLTTLTNGRVAFLRNDSGDAFVYVVAINGAGPYDYRAYQVDVTPTVQHTYTIATGQTPQPMEATGFVAEFGNKDITVALSFLDATLPPKNSTDVYTVTFAGVSTKTFSALTFTLASRTIVSASGGHNVVLYFHSDPTNAEQAQQSTFFLYNIVTGQICGRWNWGTAYADWQVASDTRFYMHLPSPTVAPDGGRHVPLAYRVKSSTARVDLGDDNVVTNVVTNTVGVEDVSFGPDSGQAFQAHGELLIPGPRTSVMALSGFVDHGAPLIPDIASSTQGGSGAGGKLTPGGTYTHVAVLEETDNNGNAVYSAVGPPVTRTLGGAQNQLTLVAYTVHGPVNTNARVSFYRTVWNGTQQSTEMKKVTSDLAPVVNDQGVFTVTFVDTVTDAQAALGETLYAGPNGQGMLDRFPCPPFKAGCGFENRAAVIGPDNALWVSGEKEEGNALWWNPALRVTFPTKDTLSTVVALDNFLVVFGDAGDAFVLPTKGYPDNTGAGTVPTPTLLPFANGSPGFAIANSDGIFYASTQGGIWSVTRDLRSEFVGKPVMDETAASPVVAMAGDAGQRTIVLLANGTMLVWDGISDTWSTWTSSAVSPKLVTDHKGAFAAIQSGGSVFRQTAGAVADSDSGGVPNAIITTAEVICHLGDVRGFKRIWNQQYWAEIVGAHQMTITETFDDDFATTVFTYGPFTPPGRVTELPPKVEECSSVGLKFVDSFPGGPSAGFALELLAFEVGVIGGLGRLPPSFRVTAT